MKLTPYSRNRCMTAAELWRVPKEYFDPLYNYLVYGFEPGGFWTSVLANDVMGAMQRSHPANQIAALKNTVGWIQDQFPALSYGSYKMVDGWLGFTEQQRRGQLEACALIYTEQEEVEMALRGRPVQPEPQLFG
jgi:hypothetical protein